MISTPDPHRRAGTALAIVLAGALLAAGLTAPGLAAPGANAEELIAKAGEDLGQMDGIAAEARHHIEVQGAGHYGIFSGSRWRKTVYPQVRDFILAHQPASATAASAAGHLSSVSDDGPELESSEAHADKSAKAVKTGQNSAPAQKGRDAHRARA